MSDVEELGRVLGTGKRVAKHAVAKRAGGADGFRSGIDEFLSTDVIDTFAGFFAEEDEPTTCPATERALAGTRRVDYMRRPRNDLPRLVVDAAITAEIAGIVEDDAFVCWSGGKLVDVTGEKLAVMLNFDGSAEFAPVLRDGADTVRTDGDDLFDIRLLERGEIGFGQLAKGEIVAETARRVAGAALFFKDAEGCAEVAHDGCERSDDLAATRVVGAHAAEPEAVLLGTVEDGELLFGDEFVALSLREAHGVAVAFKI